MNSKTSRCAAGRYDPSTHARCPLPPYRDVLLLWRAKSMSYEKIAATLTKHGLKTSPTAVGVFCQHAFTESEIAREQQRLRNEALKHPPTDTAEDLARAQLYQPPPAMPESKKRGHIARDNY